MHDVQLIVRIARAGEGQICKFYVKMRSPFSKQGHLEKHPSKFYFRNKKQILHWRRVDVAVYLLAFPLELQDDV